METRASVHRATLRWRRGEPGGRTHQVRWPRGDAATTVGPFDEAPTNPEELLVAALASCHLAAFLAVAARDGWQVESYDDAPEGVLGKNARGRTAVTHVTLRPRVRFAGPAPDAATLARMHESAHRGCYIAASVACEITVAPVD